MPSRKVQIHLEMYQIEKEIDQIDDGIIGTMRMIPDEYLKYVKAIAKLSFDRGRIVQNLCGMASQKLKG